MYNKTLRARFEFTSLLAHFSRSSSSQASVSVNKDKIGFTSNQMLFKFYFTVELYLQLDVIYFAVSTPDPSSLQRIYSMFRLKPLPVRLTMLIINEEDN